MVNVVNQALDGRLYYPVWDGCVQCPLLVSYVLGDGGYRLVFRLFRVLWVDGVYGFALSGVCDVRARRFGLGEVREWLADVDGGGGGVSVLPLCLCYGMRLQVWDWRPVVGDFYTVGDRLFVFLVGLGMVLSGEGGDG